MSTLFNKSGFAARLALLLAVVMGTFAGSATPAAASRSLPPTDLGGSLGVYVFDNSSMGKGPIYSAGVTVYNMAGVVVLKGSTNKSGWFTGDLEEGKYVVSTTASGYVASKTIVSVIGGTDTATKVGLTKQNAVAKGVLIVQTWGAPSPAPVPLPRVFVVIWDPAGVVVAKGFTTNIGLFTVTLDPGLYKIKATADGYKPTMGEGRVISNQETTADIILDKVAVAMGQVSVYVYQNSTNQIIPLPGAFINIYRMDGLLVATGSADNQGKYGTALGAGIYTLEVGARGYQAVKLTIKVDPSRDYSTAVFLNWEPK